MNYACILLLFSYLLMFADRSLIYAQTIGDSSTGRVASENEIISQLLQKALPQIGTSRVDLEKKYGHSTERIVIDTLGDDVEYYCYPNNLFVQYSNDVVVSAHYQFNQLAGYLSYDWMIPQSLRDRDLNAIKTKLLFAIAYPTGSRPNPFWLSDANVAENAWPIDTSMWAPANRDSERTFWIPNDVDRSQALLLGKRYIRYRTNISEEVLDQLTVTMIGEYSKKQDSVSIQLHFYDTKYVEKPRANQLLPSIPISIDFPFWFIVYIDAENWQVVNTFNVPQKTHGEKSRSDLNGAK